MKKVLDFVVLCGVVGIAGLGVWSAQQAERDSETRTLQRRVGEVNTAPIETEESLKEWPDLPTPYLEDRVVQFPDLPTPTRGMGDATALLQHRFDYIVDNYPDKAFARKARRAIDSGKVKVEFVVIGDDLPASFRLTKSGPTILVDSVGGLMVENNGDILRHMFAVRHEFEHAEQAMATTDPVEMRTWTMSSDRVQTPEECAFLWGHEYGAYRAECLDVMAFGYITFERGMCIPVSDETAFKQMVFKRSVAHLGWVKWRSECIPTWARLAGHPHPEAYE